MRSHFSEDSSSWLTEMSNLVQSVIEVTYDFDVTLISNQVMALHIILGIISILVIKQAVSHRHASGLPKLYYYKSKCTHCFVCGSEDHRKPVYIKIKKGVAQQRHDTTNKNKSSKNICCVCLMKSKTVHKCCGRNSGCYCS